MSDEIESRPTWDATFSEALIGKVMLAGITYLNHDESLIEQQEFFGEVLSADSQKGILLRLHGRRLGEQYNLPPDMRSIVRASLGEYRLRSTGEIVENPDYLVTFDVYR